MSLIRVPDLQKFEWQKSVKDKDILTPPGTPAGGDRYLIVGAGADAWAGKDNQIATWTGTAWEYTIQAEGMQVWVADEDKVYRCVGGTTWTIEPTHVQQHSITATADHTSSATAGRMLKADTNGLPVNATNTDTDVADAVSKRHAAGADTTLGTMATDIVMGTHQLTGLSVPDAAGEAIRQTATITETALGSVITKVATLNATLGTVDFEL